MVILGVVKNIIFSRLMDRSGYDQSDETNRVAVRRGAFRYVMRDASVIRAANHASVKHHISK